jgi:hypothetical protein
VSGGLLTIQTAGGGWVRSQATYTHGTIEAIAEFGTGPNQHIGFGSNGFAGDRYFIFSTHSGDGNLYARANNSGSEQTANLGLIPTGKHRYRIEWSALNSGTDRVRFYLDGLLQFQADVSNGGATNFYLYLSNAADASPLRIDAAQAAPPYVSSGNYTSCVLDAGVGNAWQTANWEADIPAMTGLTVETRTSFDGLIWGPWAAVPGNGGAISQPRRYAQYRLLFTTSNSQRTAIINSVILDFGLNLNEEGNSVFLPLIIK